MYWPAVLLEQKFSNVRANRNQFLSRIIQHRYRPPTLKTHRPLPFVVTDQTDVPNRVQRLQRRSRETTAVFSPGLRKGLGVSPLFVDVHRHWHSTLLSTRVARTISLGSSARSGPPCSSLTRRHDLGPSQVEIKEFKVRATRIRSSLCGEATLSRTDAPSARPPTIRRAKSAGIARIRAPAYRPCSCPRNPG